MTVARSQPARVIESLYAPSYRPRVIVKLGELPGPVHAHGYADGLHECLATHGLAPWPLLAAHFPQSRLRLDRLITTLTPLRLAELESQANQLLGGTPIGLTRYYRIFASTFEEAEQIAAVVNGWSIVELAFVESPPGPPPTLYDGDSHYADGDQGYLDPAPDGIGAKPAWDAADRRGEPQAIDPRRGLGWHQLRPVQPRH